MELQFPLYNDTSRKTIHINMDAFFVSVEERDHPEFRGCPLIIARHLSDTGGRGIATITDYGVRRSGIHSVTSAQKVYEFCPQATLEFGDHHKCSDISKQVWEVFYCYIDIVEPVSIDEAHSDVTENKTNRKSVIKTARIIQADIWENVQLTCSAGVSYGKLLARPVSDYQKPRGITVVASQNAAPFSRALPIEKFHEVGRETVPRMHELGICTGEDLYERTETMLTRNFGKMGYSLYRKVRGIHDSPVDTTGERKPAGKEHIYGQPL